MEMGVYEPGLLWIGGLLLQCLINLTVLHSEKLHLWFLGTAGFQNTSRKCMFSLGRRGAAVGSGVSLYFLRDSSCQYQTLHAAWNRFDCVKVHFHCNADIKVDQERFDFVWYNSITKVACLHAIARNWGLWCVLPDIVCGLTYSADRGSDSLLFKAGKKLNKLLHYILSFFACACTCTNACNTFHQI